MKTWGYEVAFWCYECKRIYQASLDDPLKDQCPRCDSCKTTRYESVKVK